MKPYSIKIINDQLALAANQAAARLHPRKMNWRGARPTIHQRELGAVAQDLIRYRGKYSGYNGSYFTPVYHSLLRVENKYNAVYTCGFKDTRIETRVLRAPAGTEWDVDGSLISSDYSVEYHPTAEDMMSKHFAGRVKAAMREAKLRRAEELRAAEIEAAGMAGCRVTLEDSRRAGNCVEGSLRFAEQVLRIPRESILAAPWLVTASGADLIASGNPRALAACRVAYRRETAVQI